MNLQKAPNSFFIYLFFSPTNALFEEIGNRFNFFLLRSGCFGAGVGFDALVHFLLCFYQR